MIKLYTDAAVNQHTGHTAIGILIVHNGKQLQLNKVIEPTNNHEAEFIAAIDGFKKLIALKIDPSEIIFFNTDSKIVSDSLNKQYAKHFEKYVDELLDLQGKFDTVVNTWIPDSQNMGAHTLAIQALHSI
ncbi:ribonuclease HI family protein [Lentilactobacillus kefiri]|uniref:Ribonuclease HI n=1 Tax=Lentilactobacillus kefiri TaxID=33962 RepID=A0A511DRA6_LENKE|nr:ribonuclease HI family protein [Lentilactobacillus kefiri]KRL62707.1 ribonuclease H [Lentilactobacillus parakefiri DSM 10551]MCJ2160660.1 ribonuclease HI family protein [Lentilactobacillus kefiri]MCP9367915.1 ribonuclease HI family protein [Lentilactobacillus kefiri]MDH5107535.1 ribonuclease HI family protein [Lentilactobacillus kefiri]MDM7491911.1 ribonuclease HI family protein [Lentilactobacillus kefiri]